MAKTAQKQNHKPASKQNHKPTEQKAESSMKSPAIVRTENKQVANVDQDEAELLIQRMKSDPGGGLSKSADDNLVPLIYLLQPLSPQVLKGDPAYIKGAEAGDMWLRNAEDPIVKSDIGMVFQPCHFWKDIVEWIPNRGGFAGRHDISCLPNKSLNKGWTGTLKDVQEITDDEDPNAWPKYIRKSNNNEVVETRYFAGYVYFDDKRIPLPFIIPLASTGHSFGKQWMFLMNSQTLPDGTPTDKSWTTLYRLTSKMKSNAKGSWFMYEVQKERGVKSLAEYERGLALNNAFASGEKKIDDDMMEAAAAGRAAAGELNNDEM